MFLHVFRHIEPYQHIRLFEQIIRQHLDKFGLTDAGRPGKDQRNRALMHRYAGTLATNGTDDGRNCLILTDNAVFDAIFELFELLKLLLPDIRRRNPCPYLHHVGKIRDGHFQFFALCVQLR